MEAGIAALGKGTCNLGAALLERGTAVTDGISHGFNDLHPGINQYINHLTITARLNILILSLVALLTPFLLLSRPSSLNLQFYRSLYGMNAASPENALTNGIYSIHRIRHASFHVISTSPQPQLLSCKVAGGVRKKPKSRSCSGIWNSGTVFCGLWGRERRGLSVGTCMEMHGTNQGKMSGFREIPE